MHRRVRLCSLNRSMGFDEIGDEKETRKLGGGGSAQPEREPSVTGGVVWS